MRNIGMVAILTLLSACRFQADPKDEQGRRLFRVGYMPNLTHAPALLGFESGEFDRSLGEAAAVKARPFASGPSVMEALFAGEIDVAYVGPNPAINGHQRSFGRALRVVAGATSGGAQLVVQPRIDTAQQLRGQKVASPALGNTQDVALRGYLESHGEKTRGNDRTVEVLTVANSDILSLFRRGEIAGAWVPEPWASRLVVEAEGKVLVDERTLWPEGIFPTTVVVASTVALDRRPELVRQFVAAHQRQVEILASGSEQARAKVLRRLATEIGKPLPTEIADRAFAQLSFTVNVFETQLSQVAKSAFQLDFLKSPEVSGLVDARLLPPTRPLEVALP